MGEEGATSLNDPPPGSRNTVQALPESVLHDLAGKIGLKFIDDAAAGGYWKKGELTTLPQGQLRSCF